MSEPSIVFVPGFMQRGEAWSEVARRVGSRYRTLCLDPVSDSADGRLAEIAAAADPDSVVVGYSLGGRLALHVALQWPRRLSALVLVGAHAGIEDEGARSARRRADEALAAWMESRPIEAVVQRWESLGAFATQDAGLVRAQSPGRLSHDPARLAALLRSAGQGTMPPVWDRLSRLERPVLLLAGDHDPAYVDAQRRMAALLPRGQAAVVAGAGHAAHLERPDAVAARLLDFLSATRA
jgi:2-succinyl-6-hydroxy-2,4-cyclohexadiene-1-carboxylate synthase